VIRNLVGAEALVDQLADVVNVLLCQLGGAKAASAFRFAVFIVLPVRSSEQVKRLAAPCVVTPVRDLEAVRD